MSYLEIVKGVNRNRIYRGREIRYRIVVVLWSLVLVLVLVLDSVRGGCSDGMCDSKVDGDSDVDEQEITAPVGWEKSPKMTKDLTAIGFSFQHEESIVYVKKHMTEEVAAPASDSTVALTLTNSTERTDQSMVLWPEPELEFTMPKISEVGGLQKVLNALEHIVVIKAQKAVFIYKVEYSLRCEDRLKLISQVINVLECEELELRIEEYDIKRYSHWVSQVKPSLTELEETIRRAASNSKHNLTINVCCLNPSRVDLSPLNMSLRNLASKPALIVTIMQEQNDPPSIFKPKDPYRHLYEVQASTHIDFTALHNQEIQCQKIVIDNELKCLALTGLENATTNIHSEIVLELRWKTLLYLIENTKSIINVHTIIAIRPEYTQELFQPHLLPEKPLSTPRIIAIKITIKTNLEGCWCLENMYNQYYSPEVYAIFGISVDESTIEYTKRQNGLLDTLKALELHLEMDCEKSIEHVTANGIKCPAEDCSNNKWELQESVDINLGILYDLIMVGLSNCDRFGGPYVVFCQNIRYTDIHIDGVGDCWASTLCQTVLNLFINITACTLRISNVIVGAIGSFDLSKIEGNNALPEICRRRLVLKTLILDNVDDSLIYWILNNYTFANSMEVHILNQGYKNLNITQILSRPTCRKISKLVLNDFVGLDEVRLYEEYKKEGRLTELPLFNYIERMKAKDKTITDLGLNKLLLPLEGIDDSKYTEILAKFNDIGIQCGVIPLAANIHHQMVDCKSYIMTATQYALRHPNNRFYKELVLRNINLQELEADLASRCTTSTSQPDPNQEQKPSIQKLSLDKLSLYFSDTNPITENNLVKILDWIACQFTDLEWLDLYNLEVSQAEQWKMLVHNYHVNGLDVFRCYSISSKSAQINLLAGTIHNIRLAEFNISRPDIVVVDYTMIPHILKLDLTGMDSEAHLYKLATAIKKSTSIICSMCSLSLYRPIEVKRKSTMWKLCCATTKKANPDTVSRFSILNPELHFKTVCYFACDHLFCIECVWKMKKPHEDLLKCPTCKKHASYKKACQLVYAPLPNLVLVKSNIPTSIPESQQSKITTWRTTPTFFYASYKYSGWMHPKPKKEASYNTTTPLYAMFI
ncbi:hypothetical protein NEHOM01_2438 [Nematocida homosporus]|uniref:uncharacterized protein n=1 Tax=Nematocida homosporus TaxID=1912981 RepID=UPI00221F4955|nr:uncharacterized protein NEHOM01_2438 [Nematocida homosporus]KAI5187904.1 hypothetical protein NEHOM01_2438 [Nematocida homosporus]